MANGSDDLAPFDRNCLFDELLDGDIDGVHGLPALAIERWLDIGDLPMLASQVSVGGIAPSLRMPHLDEQPQAKADLVAVPGIGDVESVV